MLRVGRQACSMLSGPPWARLASGAGLACRFGKARLAVGATRPHRGRIYKPRAEPWEERPIATVVHPNGVTQRRRDWQSAYRAMDTRCVGSRVFVTPRWGLTTDRIGDFPRAPPWADESCTFGAAGRASAWAANVVWARATIVWAACSRSRCIPTPTGSHSQAQGEAPGNRSREPPC
jgi:hypothetical protein